MKDRHNHFSHPPRDCTPRDFTSKGHHAPRRNASERDRGKKFQQYTNDEYDAGGNYRGELYSRRLKCDTKSSFFFNLKQNREGDIYLNIVESRNQNKVHVRPGGNISYTSNEETLFKRHSILIFSEQRQGFARECLAALEALGEGQDYRGQAESLQRQFSFQTQCKRHNRLLIIREDSHHYGKPLQEQLQIPQNIAGEFSQTLIQSIEKWLEIEQEQPSKAHKELVKERTQEKSQAKLRNGSRGPRPNLSSGAPPRKKVLTVRAVRTNTNTARE